MMHLSKRSSQRSGTKSSGRLRCARLRPASRAIRNWVRARFVTSREAANLLRVAFVWPIVVFGLTHAALSADASLTVAHVLDTWRHRQDRISSVWVEFENTEVLPKGMTPAPFGGAGGAPLPFPPEDWRGTFACIYAFDGSKFRYGFDGARPSAESGAIDHHNYVSVSNGTRAKFLLTLNQSKDRRPTGVIAKNDRSPDADLLEVWPILAAYRCLDLGAKTGAGVVKSALRPSADWIDGSDCAELSQHLGPYRYSLWIDPKRECLPVRIHCHIFDGLPDGRPSFQIELKYAEDASREIVLAEWHTIWFSHPDNQTPNARPAVSKEYFGKVTNTRLRAIIDPAEFDIVFPEGAEVRDVLARKMYVVGKANELREILPAERETGLTRDELMRSRPGELVPRIVTGRGASRSTILILTGCLVAIGLSALVMRRRVRRRR